MALKLKHDRLSYQANRDELSVKELKAEYTRFKRIAKDRFSRMGEFKNTARYKYYSEFFKEGVRGKSESQLRKMVYEAYTYVSNPANTVSELRKRQKSVINSINDMAGEDILNKQNVGSFYDFMNDKKAQAVLKGLDSSQKVELFRMKMKGVSTNSLLKDFSKYLDNAEAVNEYLDKHPKGKRSLSSYDLRRILK